MKSRLHLVNLSLSSIPAAFRLTIVFLVSVESIALAQQVATDPVSTHIFPAGGRRGTSVAVRVGGECLPPRTRFLLSGTGIKAPNVLGEKVSGNYEPSPRRNPSESHNSYPKEWQSRINIDASA